MPRPPDDTIALPPDREEVGADGPNDSDVLPIAGGRRYGSTTTPRQNAMRPLIDAAAAFGSG